MSCVPEYTEKLEEAWKLKTRKHKAPKDKILNNVICILLNLVSNQIFFKQGEGRFASVKIRVWHSDVKMDLCCSILDRGAGICN